MQFGQLLRVVLAELYSRRNTVLILFVVISLFCLYLATDWPKKYTSFSIIQIDKKNILQPLMKGAAETTSSIDHVINAREIIYGDKIMDQLLIRTELIDEDASDIDLERVKRSIKSKVSVDAIGDNLLRIQYHDSNAEPAYSITSTLADLFITEGEQAKVNESESAFLFIEKQVNQYLQKLASIENAIKDFRLDNPDIKPGETQDVSTRINKLRDDIEEANLKLRETHIKKDSISNQLSGEVAIVISQTREAEYRDTITQLTSELETLRLDYKETYPEIVRLKHQIKDIRGAMQKEIDARERVKRRFDETGTIFMDEAMLNNPLFQQLRSSLSTTETEIAALEARIRELENLLQIELDKSKRISIGQAKYEQITRDYNVNQEIYQDLLRRLESARVSRSVDLEQKGLTYKIQEPAKLPLIPTGIRFTHLMIAGLVLGISIPVGLIVLLVQFDPRIRFSSIIASELKIPVLADIEIFSGEEDEKNNTKSLIVIFVVIAFVLSVYGYVVWLKYTGQIA